MESTTSNPSSCIIDNNDNSNLSNLYFGKTPKISENKPSHVIGIIDCSGSMSSHFNMLCDAWNDFVKSLKPDEVTTVLFSSSAKVKEGNLLAMKDCTGSTNILSGFEVAFSEIKNLQLKDEKDDFLVLFISDGEDDQSATILGRIKAMGNLVNVKVKLICVGVGTNFPTFVSMELRLKYHNGSLSIPPVFLVFTEYDYENKQNEFSKAFGDVRQKYVGKLEEFEVSPAVFRFPWALEENQKKAKYEEATFYISKDEQNIFKNERIIENKKFGDLSEEETLELLRTWLQNLLLQSIDKSVKKEAEILYSLAAPRLEQLKLPEVSKFKNKAITLRDRINLKEMKTKFAEYENIIAEIKRLKLGVSLKDLTEDEAAKRLAIGTKQGKFHTKALQMRGITQEDFDKYKKEFLEILSKTNLSSQSQKSSQENSFTILQNQKDIFSDPDLAESLEKASLYEILDVIPLVGQTCKILISDSAMINPFNVDVVYIPKINKTCDTYTLVENHNEMEVPIGAGQKENFNAVIPLFDQSDSDLGPLVRSSLFHLMMTFNCMRNLDTFFPEAYLALLSNFLVKLLKEPESQWRAETIDKVIYTAEIVYGKSKLINKTIELLQGENPRLALITEKADLGHKCENVSKVVLALFIMKRRNLISENKIPKLIEYMIIEATGRQMKNMDQNDMFQVYNGEEQAEDYEQAIHINHKIKTQDNSDSQIQIQILADEEFGDEAAAHDYNLDSNDGTVDPKTNASSRVAAAKKNTKEKIDFGVSQKAKSTLGVEEIKRKFSEEFLKEQKIEKIEDIKTLKHLFKTFFSSNYNVGKLKTENKLKLNQTIFNKLAMKFNFAFWYKLQAYLCKESKEKINNEIFWVAVYHNIKNTASAERNEKEINYNYNEVKIKQTEVYLNSNLKSLIDSTYEKTLEKLYTEHLADYKNSIKLVKDLNCTTDLLKNKASYQENPAIKKTAMFLGLKGSGKSSLVGKLMHDLNLLDDELFKMYKIGYQTIFPGRENHPFEWISNTDADERSTGLTLRTNISHINYNQNYIKIYDTPGKFQHFRNSLKDLNLIDSFFLCLEADSAALEDANNSNFIANVLKILKYSEKIKSVNVIITKIDKETNEEKLNETIGKIHAQISEILNKNWLKSLAFTITPVSVHGNTNIIKVNKTFKLLNENNVSSISEKSVLELLLNQDNKDETFRAYQRNELYTNTDINRFIFSKDQPQQKSGKKPIKASFSAIILTRKLNKKFLDKKLVSATVVSGRLESNHILLSLPNLQHTKIDSLQINYNKISIANEGDEVSLLLNKNIDELQLDKETNIFFAFSDQAKLNQYSNDLVKTHLKQEKKSDIISSVEANLDYFGNSNLKLLSRVNVDYKGFSMCFYIESFERLLSTTELKIDVEQKDCLVKGKKYKVLLKPVTNTTYFENIYWNHKNDSTFVVRGKYYSVDAFGELARINLN